MTSFKRARSDEQRAERRRVILETAAAMLREMPVAALSLNELSRRVCLAKSNVLRYFESREAVLLELLDHRMGAWLAHLAEVLAATVDPDDPASRRGDQLAEAVATSLAREPVLCDLASSQAAVLERNVSPEVAIRFKHAAIGHAGAFADLARAHVPELSPQDATRLAAATFMVGGAIWAHSQPTAAMLAAYESDPALAALRVDFGAALRETLEVLISGLLARSQR